MKRDVRRVVRPLVKKVISTWTSSRTTLLMRRRTSFDYGSSRFRDEELATPPPAVQGGIVGEAASAPSLPTTGWRGRGHPRHLGQLAGGGVASWDGAGKRWRGQQLRESSEREAERESGEREAKKGGKRRKGGSAVGARRGSGEGEEGEAKKGSRRRGVGDGRVQSRHPLTLRVRVSLSILLDRLYRFTTL